MLLPFGTFIPGYPGHRWANAPGMAGAGADPTPEAVDAAAAVRLVLTMWI